MEVNAAHIAAFRKDHDRVFCRRFLILGDVGMTYSWGGRLCLSRNSATAFGGLEPGLFFICCQNRLGTAKGTLVGIGAMLKFLPPTHCYTT